jgi:hypothetical protein
MGGDKAGQAGQEIYGAGAAFVFASRAFHHIDGAPFTMFCDAFLLASDRTSDTSLYFHLGGDPAGRVKLIVMPADTKSPSGIVVSSDPAARSRVKTKTTDVSSICRRTPAFISAGRMAPDGARKSY